MIGAAARSDEFRPHARPVLLGAIVAAHLMMIWLLLRTAMPTVASAPLSTLALVDVSSPVAPMPPSVPTAPDDGGGSAGRQREQVARRILKPAMPGPEQLDSTSLPFTAPAPPLPAAGTAPVDLGLGGAAGAGLGSGTGNGLGDGDDDGDGDGGNRELYARADWVKRPPEDVVRPFWPDAHRKLAVPVTTVLRCRVKRSGRPHRCKLISETPRLGFRMAALAATAASRIRPLARNGELLWDVPVIVTIVFHTNGLAPIAPSN